MVSQHCVESVGFGLPTSGFAATEAARPNAVRKKVTFILEEVGVCVLV
jgi:hypothetical protein